ncbi:cupin domain-containing protein [Acidisoma sp. 7E03]
MPQVGQKIRELRARRSLSVRELALRSGVSHSAISLIERNRMSPSVETLSAILDALGTTLTGFFSELQSQARYSPFYRKDEFVEIGQAKAISYRMLGINHPNRQILMLHESYAPGADTATALSHSAQEAGMVLSGQVELTVGTEVQSLGPGDGYYFDSRQPHRFRNVAAGKSEILSAVTPPTY